MTVPDVAMYPQIGFRSNPTFRLLIRECSLAAEVHGH